ncbi:Peptidoglycan-binding lysin domain protein [Geobacter metallireducens RCH3]|uniref:LysM domain protein n=1 Tax=Geobacter metallireducens (strain ATCC 53774 / DSM 7210 / GS-15) TaxID=269799 RepID=Q39X93_GEOMG|nr:LysM domain-containing protein [Geobacter metallireducens]ABB31131.1 LysM domain protein [Geobacter metallireducens GS-15]EHP86913.1 Peptidoglycan-binding lysin domain protein [Geobacter metallireducens RCH3]
MKRVFSIGCMLLAGALLTVGTVRAASEEPTIYVIQKGDTLWGLSDRFLKDPYYWPNLWARNPAIGNPHFIYPGQRVRVYPDRIEIEPRTVSPGTPAVQRPSEEPVAERSFLVSGSEGFLMEKGLNPAGRIITTSQNRQIVGEDDIVYTDIGSVHGAKEGDRFSIYKKLDAVSHPVSNVILGEKVIPLGTLQLTEVEEKVSKAIITKSYREIGPGSILLPYRDKRRQISLKAADHDLSGYIVETQSGNNAIGEGDIAFIDLGKKQGIEPGYFLYILRDVVPDQQYADISVEKLPPEVVGALVVVQSGENTSTGLVVKSIDTIYRGDRVEARTNR